MSSQYWTSQENKKPKGGYSGGGGDRAYKPLFLSLPVNGIVPIHYALMTNENVPDHIINDMSNFSQQYDDGFVARTMSGSPIHASIKTKLKWITLPYSSFNDGKGDFVTTKQAKAVACRYGPGLADQSFKLWSFQGAAVNTIAGRNLDAPVRLLLCWTEGGEETLDEVTTRTGRLNITIKLASHLNIPVFNLGRDDALSRANEHMNNFNNMFEEGSFDPTQFDYKPRN